MTSNQSRNRKRHWAISRDNSPPHPQPLSPEYRGEGSKLVGSESMRRFKRTESKGAAIMELAVCLPLLVTLTMATVEACAMIYLKQTLKIAAFEGARIGLIPSSGSVNIVAPAL